MRDPGATRLNTPHLVDTLNKFNVPEKEHNELMAIIGTLRPDIVEVEDQ